MSRSRSRRRRWESWGPAWNARRRPMLGRAWVAPAGTPLPTWGDLPEHKGWRHVGFVTEASPPAGLSAVWDASAALPTMVMETTPVPLDPRGMLSVFFPDVVRVAEKTLDTGV